MFILGMEHLWNIILTNATKYNMKQTILSQIDIYEGEIKMPKFFDINRSELKADILESYVTQNVRSNNKLDYASMDYNLPYHLYQNLLLPLENLKEVLNYEWSN